jgi:hypothetical protein
MIGSRITMASKKSPARSWKNIRSALNQSDRKELLKLVGDLYALRKENQDFLFSRYLKDDSNLASYKKTIENHISPAEPWKTPVKISLARRAIRDYKKAIGDPKGLAELMLFYAECGFNYTIELGDIDEAFYNSIVSVYRDGLVMLNQCDQNVIDELLPHFKSVFESSYDLGWGLYDALREDLEFYFPDY